MTEVYVRFENVHTDQIKMMGPYPFVQLTYALLRVGPMGDDLACFDQYNGTWCLMEDCTEWTDVIIAPPD
jgi:hypothetical protein